MKKALSLTLALVLMLGLGMVASASAEGETLTMLQRLPATYVIEGNPVIEAWGDMYGITIEIEAPPISSFNDRRNIIMASGDLPDLIYVGDTSAMYTQWSKEGLFLNLDEYFTPEIMPNATSVLTETELFAVTVLNEDGTSSIYSMPRVQTKPWDNIIYRGDWLEAVGMEVPKTAAEFAAVALAFTTQDPDGNGVDDTFGWSLNTEMGPEHRSIVSAFGVRPTEVPDEDGNYVLMQAQDGYQEYLDWMRDMYAAGSLDPEFYITKMYEDDDLFYAGKFGIVYCNKVTEHVPAIPANDAFKGANPDGWIVAGPPLMAEGQTVADVYYGPQIWGNYAINADSELIDLAIKVLDDGYTDEVNELLLIGLEGVTYTEFDSVRRYASKTDEQKANADMYVASYATINYQRADKGLLLANGNTEEEVEAFTAAYDLVGPMTNRVAYLNGPTVPGYGDVDIVIEESGIRDEWKETRTKYITGEITREQLEDFIYNKMVPAHQGLLDLYAAYNDGEGFNK